MCMERTFFEISFYFVSEVLSESSTNKSLSFVYVSSDELMYHDPLTNIHIRTKSFGYRGRIYM